MKRDNIGGRGGFVEAGGGDVSPVLGNETREDRHHTQTYHNEPLITDSHTDTEENSEYRTIQRVPARATHAMKNQVS